MGKLLFLSQVIFLLKILGQLSNLILVQGAIVYLAQMINKQVIYSFVFVLQLVACNKASNKSDASTAISKVMQQQTAAWNKGDLEAFMQPYWQSDSLIFIGKKGITKGWNKTLANYKQSYPDKAAMGRLVFDIYSTQQLSDSSAYTIGKWELFRSKDTLSGHYTLLWKKRNNNWQIVADHSS